MSGYGLDPAAAPGLSGREIARKIVHMGVGGIAFAVVYIGPFYAMLCALAALLSNLFVLPRLGGKLLWRGDEVRQGISIGIVLYPFSVLLLILHYWNHIEVAVAIWGILAFGDGMASVVGRGLGGPRLPWNPRKTLSGSLAYFLFGGLGAAILLVHTLGEQGEPVVGSWLLGVSLATALLGAAIESLPLGIDDNLSVPLLCAPVMYGLLQSQVFFAGDGLVSFFYTAALGFLINLVFAQLAYRLRSVDKSGAVVGTLLGTLIFASLGFSGWLLLLAFFVLGTGATKIGYARKAAAGLAQQKGGRRSARHAIANSGVAAVCAFFAASTPDTLLYLAAFAGAFATAAGDTMSSEIGQLWGRRTFLITTLKPVPRGTDGAISLEGTLAGLGASAAVAFLGAGLSFYSFPVAILITLAAFLGTMLESLVGATLEQRGWLDNEAVNFLNTLCGALLAAGFVALYLG